MPPSLALGFQHPVCDSDVGCGATSFVSLAGCQGCCWEHIWDFGLLESRHWHSCQEAWPHLMRGLFLFRSLNSYLFPLLRTDLLLFTPAFPTSNFTFSFRLLLCLKFIFLSPFSLKTSCFVNTQEFSFLL